MKIGIVCPYFTLFVKGNEFYLAKELKKLGHEVVIFTSDAKAPREYINLKKDRKHPFEVIYTKSLFNFPDNPLTPFVLKDLKKEKFDILFLQEDYPLICQIAALYAKRKSIPFVISSERYYYPKKLKSFVIFILDLTINRFMWNNAKLITTHTNSSKEFFIKKIKDKKKIEVIPIGVDNSLFRPFKSNFLKDKYSIKKGTLFLSVSRLTEYKGLDYLIEGFNCALNKRKDIFLVIIGNGELYNPLSKKIRDYGIEKNVFILTEKMKNEEMPKIYNSADVYVQPSIIEPFGIAILEAMACGKPIIGSDVGGIKDTIKNKYNGLLVPQKNTTTLRNAIIKLTDKNYLNKLGKNSKSRASNKFDWKIIAKKYLEAIKK